MSDTANPSAVDGPEDFGEGKGALVKRWIAELAVADKEFQSTERNWYDTGDRIVKRYRDQRQEIIADGVRRNSKYNILWANVQLLSPALYSRTPKPEVVRRFKERDPVARAAADLIERAVDYTVDTQDFDDVMNSCVEDRLLPGRGTLWVRYVPTMREVTPQVSVAPQQVTGEEFDEAGDLISSALMFADEEGREYEEGSVMQGDVGPYVDGEPYDEVVTEAVDVDYVYWKDFQHNNARNWGEVRWVSRRTYLTRTQLRKRFGTEIANAVPLGYTPRNVTTDNEGPSPDTFKKAIVYEIWDKDTRKVYWICKGYDHGPLDTIDDPLGLTNFFPCPKPIYSTTTTDTMVPVPDYVEYQDQALELDDLTSRMQLLMKALKFAGFYNSAIKESLQEILDNAENTLVPIDNWAMFGDKGAAGQLEFLPLKEVAETLLAVTRMREQVKQDLYEITGLSDVMRGSSDPGETLGAQQLKGQYGTLRLKHSIGEVQRFARDTMRIIGEIIAEHFAPETIRDIAGMDLPTRDEVEEARAAVEEIDGREEKLAQLEPEQAQQIKSQVKAPSVSEMEKIRDVADDVPFEDAIALLRDQGHRSFRLDIETDSTIAIDEAADKKERTEYLNAAANFMKVSAEMGSQVPEYIPVLGKMMMFGLRGFKAGRRLEDDFEGAIEAIQRRIDKTADQPQEDPRLALMARKEDREDLKVQIDATDKQAKASLEARGQDIEALDDKTGHEIDREKLRAGTKTQDAEREQAATIEVVDQLNK